MRRRELFAIKSGAGTFGSCSNFQYSICFSARSRDLVNDASSKGLLKKATAPAASARARTLSLGNAVRKMIGTRWPAFSIWPCSSRPFRPGICRSVIRQEIFPTLPDAKNCSADAKVKEAYPRASTRSAIASLTNESSSTIAIIVLFDTIVFRLFLSRTLSVKSSNRYFWNRLVTETVPLVVINLRPQPKDTSYSHELGYGSGTESFSS